MTSKQLEGLVAGIKKPNLKENEVRNLLNKEDFYFQPMAQVQPQQVAQVKPQQVAQVKPQQVAQVKPQQVAQAVVQGSWVAQDVVQTVAQDVVQTVAQVKPQKAVQKVAQKDKYLGVRTQVDKDVERFKEEICQIDSIEGRKKYCINIGFGISSQSRGGKQHYLFGIKKIEGKKYSLYIGNSKRI